MGVGRREFLLSAAFVGGSMVVRFRADAANVDSAACRFNGFLSILPDSSVQVSLGVAEMGQGSSTGMAMILADELGARWETVNVRFGLTGEEAYRRPILREQITAGSTSIRFFHEPLRAAAASTRAMLIGAAAAKWGVAIDSCEAIGGEVRHPASNRAFSFGSLLRSAAAQTPPKVPLLRGSGTGGIAGTSVTRFDMGSKVDGSAEFGMDVRLDGMVYAAIRHAPVFGAPLIDSDRDAAMRARGVVAVVELPNAVAVVADRSWRALGAAAALKPKFGATPDDHVDDAGIEQVLLHGVAKLRLGEEVGDPDGAMNGAAKVLHATYDAPYLAHAPMEPQNCTVRISGGVCEIWAPTQVQDRAIAAAVKITGFLPNQIVLRAVYLGGGFGRRGDTDFIEEAVRIAVAIKRPVKLIWSRSEDMIAGTYRPRAMAQLSGGIDRNGQLSVLAADVVSQSYVERANGKHFPEGYEPYLVQGLLKTPYAIPARRVRGFIAHTHVPVGAWRSTGNSTNTFFLESFLDELAHAAGKDPYLMRRDLLRANPQALRVLDAAAAHWNASLPPGRARGIAFSDAYGSKTAMVAEVSSEGGKPRVHRIVCAFDWGTMINPDSVEAQLQGGIMFGLSAALYGRISIKQGMVVEKNFGTYRIVTMRDAPELVIKLLPSGGPPMGVGEAGVPCVAPAAANAFLALTGRPIRSLPMAL